MLLIQYFIALKNADAAIEAKKQGFKGKVQIMLPLVFSDHEIDYVMPTIEKALSDACKTSEFFVEELSCELGCMIEVPRACLRADRISVARGIRFVSFGSNDLTQLVLGISRDDTQQFMV